MQHILSLYGAIIQYNCIAVLCIVNVQCARILSTVQYDEDDKSYFRGWRTRVTVYLCFESFERGTKASDYPRTGFKIFSSSDAQTPTRDGVMALSGCGGIKLILNVVSKNIYVNNHDGSPRISPPRERVLENDDEGRKKLKATRVDDDNILCIRYELARFSVRI